MQTSKLYPDTDDLECKENPQTLCIVRLLVEDASKNEEESATFVIEWVPNSTSMTAFGQLKLEFTVGYKVNNAAKYKQIP